MAALSEFYSLIAPACPGVPEPAMDLNIVLAAQDFCRRTSWYQEVQTMDAVASQGEYSFTVPSGMRLFMLHGAWYDTAQLEIVATGDVRDPLALRGAVGDSSPETGTPTQVFFNVPSDGTFQLYPLPAENATTAITVRASFVPTNTAETVPDGLYNEWAEIIAAGAMARLMSTPNTPYFAPKSAAIAAARFETGITRARRESRTGKVQSSLAVRPRAFA